LESTRAYIERFVADLVQKDLRDPEVRRRVQKIATRAYAEAKARLGR
jgi:hypothetical protein